MNIKPQIGRRNYAKGGAVKEPEPPSGMSKLEFAQWMMDQTADLRDPDLHPYADRLDWANIKVKGYKTSD